MTQRETREGSHTFVNLNTADAEQIIHELGSALDADRKWADDLQTTLICRTKPKKIYLDDKSHKNTPFGKWFYGDVHAKVKDHPGFDAIGKNGKQMHVYARALACAVRDDKKIKLSQYKDFMESTGRFRGSLRPLLSEAWEFLRHADPLTGVMTRGAMNMHLKSEQERAKRSSQTSCVAMMDLDHFKKVNDAHGHQAGDKVLETVSRYLLESLRQYDKLFRYGGEEFLILFPNTSVQNTQKVLNRLRENISRIDIKVDDKQALRVTASFGVAQLFVDTPAKDVIDFADQALYAAKKAGRNRVRVWEHSTTPSDDEIPDAHP